MTFPHSPRVSPSRPPGWARARAPPGGGAGRRHGLRLPVAGSGPGWLGSGIPGRCFPPPGCGCRGVQEALPPGLLWVTGRKRGARFRRARPARTRALWRARAQELAALVCDASSSIELLIRNSRSLNTCTQGRVSSGVLNPALGSLAQDGHWPVGATPGQGLQVDKGRLSWEQRPGEFGLLSLEQALGS